MGMFGCACRRLIGLVAGVRRALHACLWARPVGGTHAAGTGSDLLRSRAQLLTENALLRHQLLVLQRSVGHPTVTRADRTLLVLLDGHVRAWRQALLPRPARDCRGYFAHPRAISDAVSVEVPGVACG